MKALKNHQLVKNKLDTKAMKKNKNKKKHRAFDRGGAVENTSGIEMQNILVSTKIDAKSVTYGKKKFAITTDIGERSDMNDMQSEVTHSSETDAGNDKSTGKLLDKMENNEKTVFVGNVSINTTSKALSRFFSQYGKVKSVRLRGAAVPEPKVSKKVAIIKRNFHGKRTSMIAYVTFTENEMVTQALEANGTELNGNHLHVDRVTATPNHSAKHSVFVGNLPFEAEDEELRSHFAECGDVESVRIVRDRVTGIGKGFGYINFKHADAIEIALQLDNKKFMKRDIRVKRYSKKPKPKVVKEKVHGKSASTFRSQVVGKVGKGKKMKTGKRDFAVKKMLETKSKSKAIKQKMPGKKTGKVDFSGKMMLETKEFKKMKKAKRMPNKDQRKKRAVAHILQGSN